jgi:hypothetical protein
LSRFGRAAFDPIADIRMVPDNAPMSGNPWFIYRRERGRIKAAPVTWQGWLVFLGGTVMTIALALLVMLNTEGHAFVERSVAFSIVILVGVGAICLVAVRKGRPSR